MDAGTDRFLAFVRAGDRSGIEELLRERRARCLAQAQRILGNAADADDAVQDAFLRLVRGADRYDGSVPFGILLGRLVVEASRDLRRMAERRRRREHRSVGSVVEEGGSGNDERLAEIRRLIDGLPEDLKAPIELRFYSGLSQKETAERLGVSENLVAVRVHRGKHWLRRRLAQAGIVIALGALDSQLAAAGPEGAVSAAPATGFRRRGAGSARLAVAIALTVAVSAWLIWRTMGAGPAATVGHPAGAPEEPAVQRREVAAVAAPAAERIYTWSFDAGAPSDLRVIEGSWHHLDHGGIGGSGCMETDGDHLVAVIDRPVPDGALEMTVEECPRLPAGNYRSLVIWGDLGYDYQIVNLGRGPKPLVFAAGRDNEAYVLLTHEFLGEDSIQCWDGTVRTYAGLLRRRGQAPLHLVLDGHQRIDDLRIAPVGAARMPDVSAIRRAVYAVPLEERRGRTDLRGVAGFDAKRPVQVEWGTPSDEAPVIAPND